MTETDFWAMLFGHDQGRLFEVRVRTDGLPAVCWIPTDQPRAFTRMLGADDCCVGAVPRLSPEPWALAASAVVWTRLETGQSEHRLSRFRPAPTLVIREGQTYRRWAVWALSRPLSGDWIGRANERLAHALGGPRKAADPSTLILSPFTRIRHGRRSAQPARIEFETDGIHDPRRLLSSLRDAPEIRWQRAA